MLWILHNFPQLKIYYRSFFRHSKNNDIMIERRDELDQSSTKKRLRKERKKEKTKKREKVQQNVNYTELMVLEIIAMVHAYGLVWFGAC